MNVVIVSIVVAAFVIAVTVLSSRAARHRSAVLTKVANDLDWTDVRVSTFHATKVRGMRNGVSVSMTHKPRHKSTPERIVTLIEVPAPGRLIVRKRVAGFLSNKPWLGPPILDHAELWIRADDRTLAGRFLDHRERLDLVRRNLATRFDELRVDGRGIRVERAVEGSTWGFDEAAAKKVAKEEWDLALAMSRT